MEDLDRSNPPRTYATTRHIRLFLFSLVVATVGVSLLIVLIQFVWNDFLAGAFDRAPYQARVEYILPAILIIAFLLHRVLWDMAEGPRPPKAA